MYQDIALAHIENWKKVRYQHEVELRIATRIGDEEAIKYHTECINTHNVAIEEWTYELDNA